MRIAGRCVFAPTISTDSGDFTFAAVSPGVYNIRVERDSFKAASANVVHVQVQQTLRQDFTLEVGQITESVQVSASADMLQAENQFLGTVVDNKGVAELPLNGRNYLGLVALALEDVVSFVPMILRTTSAVSRPARV